MNLNLKAGAAIAAAVLLLFIVLPRAANTGTHFKVTATEYDCNVKIADDPRPLNHEVLSTVAIRCDTPPKETDFVLQLQYKAKGDADFTDAGDARRYTGPPGPDYTDINVTQPCREWSWRVVYQLMGVAAKIGTAFQEQQHFGDPKDITKAQCDNS